MRKLIFLFCGILFVSVLTVGDSVANVIDKEASFYVDNGQSIDVPKIVLFDGFDHLTLDADFSPFEVGTPIAINRPFVRVFISEKNLDPIIAHGRDPPNLCFFKTLTFTQSQKEV